MQRVVEALNNHPGRTVAAAFLAAVVSAELMGYAQNPTHDVPEGACFSPFAVSQGHVELGTSVLFQTNTGLLTTGVVARGEVPDGAYGMQASFKHPDADADDWEVHASEVTPPNELGDVALKMAIGDGEVEFGVRIVAPGGSPLCTEIPNIVYQYLDRSDYLTTPDTTLPWRNPVAVPVNLLSRVL